MVADERFCLPIPDGYTDEQAAPLLCAGLIGYRSLRMAGDAERLGLYGFGASAHIVAQVARHQGRRVFAFTKPDDREGPGVRPRARRRVGGRLRPAPAAKSSTPRSCSPRRASSSRPRSPLLAKGGTVVCAGIHMSDIPSFPYELLWGERQVRSVANLTRADGEEFLALAPQVPVRTRVEVFPLAEANEALDRLRAGRITRRRGPGRPSDTPSR